MQLVLQWGFIFVLCLHHEPRYTCGGRFGSLGYEEIDAKTYAEWGVDYLSKLRISFCFLLLCVRVRVCVLTRLVVRQAWPGIDCFVPRIRQLLQRRSGRYTSHIIRALREHVEGLERHWKTYLVLHVQLGRRRAVELCAGECRELDDPSLEYEIS